VLLGSAEFIARGKRLKKLLGGGWRQAGMLAAAALHALDHHVERLAEDHRRARELAAGLAAIEGLAVDAPQTNLVFVTLPEGALPRLRGALAAHRVLASLGGPRVRLATHLDIDDAAVARCVEAFAEALR
jgi:threonine aldolase